MAGRRLRDGSLCIALGLAGLFGAGVLVAAPTAVAADDGSIRGVITHAESGDPIEGALVILQCACLNREVEATTNARGIYRFDGLPPGRYTVQVLSGKANVAKVMQLPRGASFRAHFRVNPTSEFVKKIIVETQPVHAETSTTTSVDMEQAKRLPVGGSTSRDFTAVVDLAPSASTDAAGISLSGASATSESYYVAPRRPRRSDRDSYQHYRETGRIRTALEHVTTFSIDVDTASYTNVRRFLNEGGIVPPAAVRVEEMINYFDYGDAPPAGPHPVAVHAEIAESPFSEGHQLLRVAVKGRAIPPSKLPPRNLVFLLDVSGSMADRDKLELLKDGMRRLTDTLRARDHVAIVAYAGSAQVILPPTSGRHRKKIHAHIDQLMAGGGTNGSGGIELAYDLAARHFDRRKINRVILGTDGDFNIGPASDDEMTALIEKKRETGVYLSVLGVGTGNLQDSKMEKIADHGNGNYAYLDSLDEAEKVLVSEAGETTVPVAKDVKIQIAFDRRRVKTYRQIGYENRRLANRDFTDDSKDAGELGANGEAVAYYEIDMRERRDGPAGEVRIRYKSPQGGESRELSVPLPHRVRRLGDASLDFRFGLAVAAFGLVLKRSSHLGTMNGDEILALAEGNLGPDPHGRRQEFVGLVRKATH